MLKPLERIHECKCKSQSRYSSLTVSSVLSADAAACATPSSLSLRQRLFSSLVEPLEDPAARLDITHTPTAPELVAHKVFRILEKEKAESKRYSHGASVKSSDFIQNVCFGNMLF